MNTPPDARIPQAQALQQAGRLVEAEQAYREILARTPALPNCWYNLGVVQRLQGRVAEALESYAQALRHGVTEPEVVHLNRAVIYSDVLQRDQEAEAELRKALQLNPRYLPAMLNLANLHEDRGQRDEARALYGQILALDPMSFLAFSRLANLVPRGGHDAQMIARLKDAVSRPEAAAGDRAHVGFALGRALDGIGDYAGAFAAYQAANRDSRASASPPVHYDRRAHEQIVDELIATPLPPPVPVPPGVRPRPIFVCGMFRSGSTLAEQVLAGHPEVGAGGELVLLPRLIATQLLPYPAGLSRAPASQLMRLSASYRSSIAGLFPAAARVTDKRPDNFFSIGLIRTLFPDAQIVHTVRDPLDTCLSVFFLHLDHRLSYALDLEDIGHFYRQYQRLMAHWKTVCGPMIIDFDYDKFVSSPEPAAQDLFAALGLSWDPGVLDFSGRARSVRTASVWQVREPLYRHASGRARHYARELAPLRAELGLSPAAGIG
jgi:tetratricopeptide (TPR) repeat protein